MTRSLKINDLCSSEDFDRLSNCVRQRAGLELFLHDAEGVSILGSCGLTPAQCCFAVEESLRWGETAIQLEPEAGTLFWSVPVMLNNKLLGGVGTCGVNLEDSQTGTSFSGVQEAANDLFTLMIQENLVNRSMMEVAKAHFKAEQEKAEAIHLVKKNFYRSIQSLYTEEEPALLAAIRRGERSEATAILNRIFVAIYNYGSSSKDLLKSYLLELVAMMSRAAVEAGSIPEGALGLNFQAITQLADLEDDEAIWSWLNEILDRLFREIMNNRHHPHSLALNKAFSYMQVHLSENVKRESTARHAGLSSSHFASLLNTHIGKSFRVILTEMRVEEAAKLLNEGSLSLAEIALACGFSDQSHFSRVFSKATQKSPGKFRKWP